MLVLLKEEEFSAAEEGGSKGWEMWMDTPGQHSHGVARCPKSPPNKVAQRKADCGLWEKRLGPS